MKNYIFLLFLLAVTMPCFAVTVCGITFADNAFADDIGTYSTGWNSTDIATLKATLCGTTVGDSIYSTNSADWMNILFTDNYIQNGAGYDLVLFEESGSGSPGSIGCTMGLTLNGITKNYAPTWISGSTYVSYVELSDFGIASNTLLSSIQIRGYTGSCPDYTAFGALNSVTVPVPEPASAILLGLFGLGFILFRRIHA